MIDNENPKRPLMEPMSLPEKSRLIKTMERVKLLYPGMAGVILADYIDSWKEFGYKLGHHAQMTLFVKEVWEKRLPDETEPAKPLSDDWMEIP